MKKKKKRGGVCRGEGGKGFIMCVRDVVEEREIIYRSGTGTGTGTQRGAV
jgi:hypothetical protein